MRSSSPSMLFFGLNRLGLIASLVILLGFASGHALLICSFFAVLAGVVSIVYTSPFVAAKYFFTLLFLESTRASHVSHLTASNRDFTNISLKPPSPTDQKAQWFHRRYDNWSSFLNLRAVTPPATKSSEILSPRSLKRRRALGDLKICLQRFTNMIRQYGLDESAADDVLTELHRQYESKLDSICMNIGSDLSDFYHRDSNFFLYVSGALRHSYLRPSMDDLHQDALDIGQGIDNILSEFEPPVIKCNPQRRSIGGNWGSAFQSFQGSRQPLFCLDPEIEKNANMTDLNDISAHSDGTGYNNYTEIDDHTAGRSASTTVSELDRKVYGHYEF